MICSPTHVHTTFVKGVVDDASSSVSVVAHQRRARRISNTDVSQEGVAHASRSAAGTRRRSRVVNKLRTIEHFKKDFFFDKRKKYYNLFFSILSRSVVLCEREADALIAEIKRRVVLANEHVTHDHERTDRSLYSFFFHKD